jgi:hypothetical protein
MMLLSACGDGFRASAAVVDGHEISQDQLQHEFDVQVAAQPQLKQRLSAPGAAATKKTLLRQFLSFLIQERVIREYARTRRISVSLREVNAQMAQIIQQQGGQVAFDRLLRERGLALSDLRAHVEFSVLQEKVASALAAAQRVGPDSAQAQQIFSDWLRGRLAKDSIRVNPLFGRLDPTHAAICAIASTADKADPCVPPG